MSGSDPLDDIDDRLDDANRADREAESHLDGAIDELEGRQRRTERGLGNLADEVNDNRGRIEDIEGNGDNPDQNGNYGIVNGFYEILSYITGAESKHSLLGTFSNSEKGKPGSTGEKAVWQVTTDEDPNRGGDKDLVSGDQYGLTRRGFLQMTGLAAGGVYTQLGETESPPAENGEVPPPTDDDKEPKPTDNGYNDLFDSCDGMATSERENAVNYLENEVDYEPDELQGELTEHGGLRITSDDGEYDEIFNCK